MFPLLVNLRDRLVIVVGGGTVGQRKAKTVRAAGANVRIIDPVRAEWDVEWIAEPYRAEHLDGAALVIAAATSDVNAAVVADALARGLWVNSASEPAGNVVFPASFAVGELTIAVGTGGASPALARQLRDKFRDELDPAYAEWVAVLARLREAVLASNVADRDALLKSFADWSWLERIRRDGSAVVLAEMLVLVPGIIPADPPHPGSPRR